MLARSTAGIAPVVFIAIAFVAAFATPATALKNPNAVTIAGFELTCKDSRGRVVRTMRVPDLGDVGRAWVINDVPFIVMDRQLLATLPPKMRIFFFKHECAHHVLGHWYRPTKNSETEADCWAIKNGRDLKLFTREEVEGFAPSFANSKGSRWGHLPGPERAKQLLACFDDPTPVKNRK